MKKSYYLFNEDCFKTFSRLRDASVDLVLCDPPYGTTQCKWDSVIPLEPMWEQVWRVLRPRSAAVVTSTGAFTAVLTCSALAQFKYRWVWQKTRPGGITNAKNRPLKDTEDICCFSRGTVANCSPNRMSYYPQGLQAINRQIRMSTTGETGYLRPNLPSTFTQTQTNYPREIIQIPNNDRGLHPTQKPVELMEYLIKTYTLEGEVVLDFAMGSGTTGVACGNLGRKFIGCDSDKEHGYFEIAKQRIEAAYTK